MGVHKHSILLLLTILAFTITQNHAFPYVLPKSNSLRTENLPKLLRNSRQAQGWSEDSFADVERQIPSQTSTTAAPVPGMGTTQSPCEDSCISTAQYSPVCGDNNRTYGNEARLRCAQRCGTGVKLLHVGVCQSALVPLDVIGQ